MEKKKKPGKYILPPSGYQITREHIPEVSTPATIETPREEPEQEVHTAPAASAPQASPSATAAAMADTAVETIPEKPKKLSLNVKKPRVSGLSLSSIRAKKEHELAKKEEVPDTENLPKSPFTEEAMQTAWSSYVDLIDKEGKKILSSALASDIPKLKNETTIWIELPNDTMKKEVERDQYPLMEYLKKHLNNYYLELEVSVNESTEKQYAFTPLEKYQKMREKNPVLDLLRQELDLEV